MLEILYEDNHIIAINKKTSDIVQADKSGDVPLSEEVKAYIKEKYNKPGEVFLGIPHRIDRPVSGVVLFARTTKALTRLNKMFQEHDEEIKKTYWAIVGNLPSQDSATLIHYMVRDTEKNKSHAYDKEKKGSKKAVDSPDSRNSRQGGGTPSAVVHLDARHDSFAQQRKRGGAGFGTDFRNQVQAGRPCEKGRHSRGDRQASVCRRRQTGGGQPGAGESPA